MCFGGNVAVFGENATQRMLTLKRTGCPPAAAGCDAAAATICGPIVGPRLNSLQTTSLIACLE